MRISALCLILAMSTSSGVFAKPEKPEAEQVSIVDLVRSPEAFDGKTVRLKAWISLRDEDVNLWAEWKDHESRDALRCVSLLHYRALAGREKLLDGKYVSVVGIFRADASEGGTVIRLDACSKLAIDLKGASEIDVVPSK